MARAAAAALALLAGACTGPMSVFDTHGSGAELLAPIGWMSVIISLIVTAVVLVLVVIPGVRRRSSDMHWVEEPRRGAGMRWIVIGGIIVPAIVILGVFLFTMFTLSATAAPARPVAATVEVIGHRWWWELRYQPAGSDPAFVTANELHVPVGQPVQLHLVSADVIHSFWVPQLAGKTDLVPGQRNQMWIEADSQGVYRGQCAEYCGLQHANMGLEVVAQSVGEYRAWAARQARPAPEPGDLDASAGLRVFESAGCASCHTIRGTPAAGQVGPDLTHIATRRTIGAGTLPNNRGNLAGWIANSQALKPGNLMPPMLLQPTDLQAVLAYLETLR